MMSCLSIKLEIKNKRMKKAASKAKPGFLIPSIKLTRKLKIKMARVLSSI